MKRKELLQKSSTVAAVVLAAALMDPGAVQASAGEAGAAASAAQVQEQSVEEETPEAVVQSTEQEAEAAVQSADQETEAQADAAESETEQQEEAAAGTAEADQKVQDTQDTSADAESGEAETTAVSENQAEVDTASDSEAGDSETAAETSAGWIQSSTGNTQYRKENGELACDEILTIDGNMYYFNGNCNLVTNQRFSIWNQETQHDDCYQADDDGILMTSKWDENKYYYYGEDGRSLEDCIACIDGAYYAFDVWGNKNSGGIFKVDAGKGDGSQVMVICRDDGTLYVNEWVEVWNGRYYCGEEGIACRGFSTVDGKQYYFDEEGGWLYRNTKITKSDGTCYLAAEDGEAVKAENNAWTEWQGGHYYVKDGQFLEDTVEKIGDSYYAFDYNGRMYDEDNGDFSISQYDEDGNYKGESHYRAQAGGALYTNIWFEEDDNRAYYQADGKACADGIYTIAGKQYSFSNIYLQTELAVDGPDGTCYIADEEGVLTEANANGWTEHNGQYYYAENGTFRRDGVEKIGDFYYMFDQSGQRLTDSEMTISGWDEENNRWYSKSYCAKEDGTLYVNEWRDEEYDNYRYYYLEDGVRAEDGIYTIDGKQYYFDSCGRCKPSSAVTVDGKNYIADKTGALTEAGDDGWIEVDGERYYAKDGQFLKACIEKIGDDYYYFTWSGAILTNAKISDWSSEENLYINYRADAEGRLYVNCWFDAGYIKEYYGEGGRGAEGICTIDGVQYAFKNAELQKNCAVEEDGTYYIADTDGLLTEVKNNEWTVVNDKYYYVKDGNFLTNCVEKIGDAYYGFSWDGSRYRDQRFDQWDEATNSYWYYQAKADGTLVTGWYTQSGNRYYYGADGKGYEGLQTIDGKQYYFERGQLMRNAAAVIDGKNYIINNAGNLTEAKNNDWTLVDGFYYYVKDGEFLKECVAKIGSTWYGFNDDGQMYEREEFQIWDSKEGQYYHYRAKKGGALYCSTWYEEDGNRYYYGENGAGYEGYQTLDGKLYFFERGRVYLDQIIDEERNGKRYIADETGALTEAKKNAWTKAGNYYYYLKDDSFLTNCVAKIGNAWYGFDWDGRMMDDTTFNIWDNESGEESYYHAKKGGELLTGWYQEEDERYYYGADGKGYEGLQRVDGKLYYFQYGRVCRSQRVEADGKLYVADENGDLIEAKNNVWTKVDGKYYYAKDNKFLIDCVAKIGNAWYGFNGLGQMYVGEDFSIWDEESGTDYYYLAKADGSLYAGGWYEIHRGVDSEWYYYGADGKGYEGIRTVNGKQYYFRHGRMYTERAVTVDGTSYLCREDGSLQVLKNNVWTYYNGYYYYVKDNQVLSDCIAKIGSSYYGFRANGMMYDEEWFEISGYDENGDWRRHTYFAKAGGALYLNSWVKKYDKWYYAGADGAAYTGLQTIGGKKYYFDDDGKLSVSNVENIEDKVYSSDENGILTEVTGNNTWERIHGAWYFIQNHKILKDGVYKIGNAYYGLDSNGVMRTDQIFVQCTTHKNGDESSAYYMANQDGTLKRNTWAKWHGAWFYFGSDGAGADGLLTINRKTYYFEDGKMIQSYAIKKDGKNYVCRSDGSLTELKNNDWTVVGGKWYYVKNGTILQDCIEKIGNTYYAFQYDGAMEKNGFFMRTGQDDEKHTYYAKDTGALVVNAWMEDGENWYYFNKNGESVNGVQTINGKKYYFDDGIMQVSRGINTYDTFYVAKSDGTLITAKNNSWVNTEGYWYYVKNNELARDEVVQISGKYYAFDHLGRMATNGMFGLSMEDGSMFWGYASESGELYTNKWVWDESFGTLYVGKDGKALGQGVQTINGVKYLFGTDCNLYRSTFLKVNGKNYAADGDGKAYELKEKWNKVGNYWYYVKNGVVVSSKLETIGSVTYFFNYEGHMTTNSLLDYVRDSYYGDEVSVIVDADGKVQKNKIYELAYGTYMVDEKGKGVEGFRTVNGIQRYFQQGWMLQSTSFQVGDINYAAADNGKVVQLANNSWTQVDKEWYYVYEGKLITSGRFEIKGKNYIFDSEGRMVSGVAVENEGYGIVGAAADGTMLTNTWKQMRVRKIHYGSDYGWLYFDDNGQALEGWKTVNGKNYYFERGIMAVNKSLTMEDGALGIADGNGVLKKANRNGWTQVDGYWYYAVNGVAAKNTIRKIGNAYYGFDSDGRMYTNRTFYLDTEGDNHGMYHAQADGKLVRNGSWTAGNGDVYYFDANGIGYEGSHKVNGVTYFFENGRLLKNAAVKDQFGNLYVVDSKGVQHAMVNNQWTLVDGYYYYALDGRVVKDDVVMINGKYYGFDEDGRMYDNVTFNMYGSTYHAASGGALLTAQQYKSGNDTYYFDRFGAGYEGVHYLAGKRCVFSEGKLVE